MVKFELKTIFLISKIDIIWLKLLINSSLFDLYFQIVFDDAHVYVIKFATNDTFIFGYSATTTTQQPSLVIQNVKQLPKVNFLFTNAFIIADRLVLIDMFSECRHLHKISITDTSSHWQKEYTSGDAYPIGIVCEHIGIIDKCAYMFVKNNSDDLQFWSLHMDQWRWTELNSELPHPLPKRNISVIFCHLSAMIYGEYSNDACLNIFQPQDSMTKADGRDFNLLNNNISIYFSQWCATLRWHCQQLRNIIGWSCLSSRHQQ